MTQLGTPKRIVLVIIFTLSIAAVSLWTAHATTSRNNPLIIVDQGMSDIGTVWMRSDFKHAIMVANTSNKTLVVDDILRSCSCATIHPRSFSLAPGERQRIDVILNLIPRGTVEPHIELIPFSVSLLPRIRQINQLIKWDIVGHVKLPFNLTHGWIDFGQIPRESLAQQKRSLILDCRAPIDTLNSTIDLDSATVHTERVGSDKYRIDVSLTPALSPGSIDATVSIRAISLQGEQLPEFKVRVIGMVLDEISVVPQEISFGSIGLKDCQEETMVVRSRNSRRIESLDVKADLPSTSVVLRSRDESQYVYQIRQNCDVSGNHQSFVRIIYRFLLDDVETTREMAIPLAFFGVAQR
jgi:hypothetical protein